MRITAKALLALGLALLAAACTPGPTLDPETFPGGVLRVNQEGVAQDIVIFVNPDGSLAGAEGLDSVEGWQVSRAALCFVAAPADGPASLAFDLPAAAFGPDYAGTVTLGGDCRSGCTRDATAWWAQGKERVALPR